MVNGILLEKYAYATVIIRNTQFIGGPGTDTNYTFIYAHDSNVSGFNTETTTVVPTTTASIVVSTTTASIGGDGSNSGDNNDIILIIVVVLVCIMIIVCVIGLIKFKKTKTDQSKNVEREFNEHLNNNTSRNGMNKAASTNDESGQTKTSNGNVNDNTTTASSGEVEMPAVTGDDK